MIWVITPHHRARDQQNIIQNFTHQTYQQKHLLVIENGAAVGTFPRDLDMPYTVLYSGIAHPGAARNVALDLIQDAHIPWANMDADDLYHPDYLGKIAEACYKYPDRLVGQNKHWTKTDSKGIFLFSFIEDYVHGATISSMISEYRYPEEGQDGEDWAMVRYHLSLGRQLYHIEPDWYCWVRTGNGEQHTYRGTDYEIWIRNFNNPDAVPFLR
jgi:hypothetical protein